MSEKREPFPVNQGIQATNVQANAIAVGPGARVHYREATAIDWPAARDSLAAFERLAEQLIEDRNARAALSEDIRALQAALASPSPPQDAVERAVKGLSGKLRMITGVIQQGAALIEPLKAIAGALRIPLALIGL